MLGTADNCTPIPRDKFVSEDSINFYCLDDEIPYIYLKSKREIESCLWAKSALKDTSSVTIESLPETINTKNAEFGHIIYDNLFIFSSLRPDSINENEEVIATEYKTNIYYSERKGANQEQSQKLLALLKENLNTGNGTFSLDGKRFYFSLCGEDSYNYRCKIMVAKYENNKWNVTDLLFVEKLDQYKTGIFEVPPTKQAAGYSILDKIYNEDRH